MNFEDLKAQFLRVEKELDTNDSLVDIISKKTPSMSTTDKNIPILDKIVGAKESILGKIEKPIISGVNGFSALLNGAKNLVGGKLASLKSGVVNNLSTTSSNVANTKPLTGFQKNILGSENVISNVLKPPSALKSNILPDTKNALNDSIGKFLEGGNFPFSDGLLNSSINLIRDGFFKMSGNSYSYIRSDKLGSINENFIILDNLNLPSITDSFLDDIKSSIDDIYDKYSVDELFDVEIASEDIINNIFDETKKTELNDLESKIPYLKTAGVNLNTIGEYSKLSKLTVNEMKILFDIEAEDDPQTIFLNLV